MKKILVGLFCVTLVGCANTTVVDSNLEKIDGIKLKEMGDNSSVIDTYTLLNNIKSNEDKILACAASEIRNASVTFTDSASSYFGQYSGQYYLQNNVYSASGGSTIVAVTDNKVVAAGVTDYYTDGLIPTRRYVRYIISISPQNNETKYVFSKIEQASQDSGAIPNKGFVDVGAWSGADPVLVIKSLDKEAQNISRCLQDN